MKKLILVICLLMGLGGMVFAADIINMPMITSYSPGTTVYSSYTVTSTAVTTDTVSMNGCQRIITNNGTATVYKTNSLYTVAITTGIGVPIYPKEHYIEDKWFGSIYFAAESGSNDVRIEDVISNYRIQ